MQLHFTTDEFQLLADVLMQRDRGLREEIARTDSRDFKRGLQQQLQLLNELEDKILGRDLQLGADELDFLAEVTNRSERELIGEIARTDHRELRNTLQRRAELLAQVRDKVTEACAMV